MIRKVYEVDPMLCPRCGGIMKVIAFLTDYAVVNRITHHLKLTFVAERPPPTRLAYQEILMTAQTSAKYLSLSSLGGEERSVRFLRFLTRLWVPGPFLLVSTQFDKRQYLGLLSRAKG